MKNIILVFILLFAASTGFAQTDVTGRVTDRNGEPVLGALVEIRGNTGIRAYTDRDGKFEIAVLPGDVLEISDEAAGLKRVAIKDYSPLEIQFTPQDEIIQLGGAARIGLRREEFTGAVSTVTSEQIMKSSDHSVSNTLFGNALGLISLQTGGSEWENEASMYIRGVKTISDNSILVLVDGIERAISFITPDEVESVTVLKDAAALALYGYRGINGALLVTTKRGQYNSQTIQFRYDKAFRQYVGLPKPVDAYTYAQAINEARTYDGLTPRYNEYELAAFRDGSMPYYYPNVDWQNEILKNLAGSSTYNLSVSGGGEKARYFTMFDLQSDRGFFKGTETNDGYSNQAKMSKANVRINLDVDITSTTTMAVNVLGILEEHNRSYITPQSLIQYTYLVPSAAFPVLTENGEWGGNATYTTWNPVASLRDQGYTRNSSRTIYSDIKLSQDLGFITNGLSISAAAGYDSFVNYRDNYRKGYTYSDYQITWDSNGVPSDPVVVTGGEQSEIKHEKEITDQRRRFDFTANLDYKFDSGRHSVFSSLIYKNDHPVYNGQHNTLYRTSISAYGHYGYDNRLYADVALVASASNRLRKSDRWKFAPAVSLGWVMSNEDFMKTQSTVNFLKFRGSYGIVHTDYVPVANYWVQQYEGGYGYYFSNGKDAPSSLSGLREGRLASSAVNTERAMKYNFGMDMTLFKQLSVTGDVYYERRSKIALSTVNKYSYTLGATGSYESGGIIDSRGVELGIDYTGSKRDFKWEVGGKFNFNRSEVVEIFETEEPYSYLESKGRPVNQLWGYEVIGFYKDEADIASSPTNLLADVAPGDYKYRDQNGDGFIDQLDRKPLGYSNLAPEYYYSFNLGFEYKGIGFSAVFQGTANYSAYLSWSGRDFPLVEGSTLTYEYWNNRWTPERGDDAKYSRLTTSLNANNHLNNSSFIHNRNFLKLRTAEIYYSFPKTWLSKIRMSNAKIYVRGMNLFSLDSMNGIDPEVINVTYPTWRSYHIGLTFGF